MCGVLDQAIVLYLNDIYFTYESEIQMISQVMNLLVLDQAIVLYLNDIYFSYESEIQMIRQVMNLLVFSEPSLLLSSSCVLCSAPSISFSLADMINIFRLQSFSYCSRLSVEGATTPTVAW